MIVKGRGLVPTHPTHSAQVFLIIIASIVIIAFCSILIYCRCYNIYEFCYEEYFV